MGFFNNIGTWFTGRNGIYKDNEKIEDAISQLQDIENNDVSDLLDDPVREAVSALNSVKGFGEYVGELQKNAFSMTIDEAKIGIEELINQINSKVNEMDEYEKGNFVEHTLGTASMVFGKVGEGFLSVFEGIGDAALTVGAWGCKAVDSLHNACVGEDGNQWNSSGAVQKFIKKDLSNFAMKGLTENGWAKKYSAITKDSGAASLCKGVGKAVGYVTVGGMLGKAAELGTGVGRIPGVSSGLTKTIEMGTNTVKVANSTRTVTAATAVSAFGQGTETGLKSGKSLGKATLQGGGQAIVEGAMAYGFGKIGEASRVNSVENYDAALSQKTLKELTGHGLNPGSGSAKAKLTEVIKAQGGYSENAFYKAGESLTENGLRNSAKSAAISAKDTFKNLGKNNETSTSTTDPLADSGYKVDKNGMLREQNVIEKGIHNIKSSAKDIGNKLKSSTNKGSTDPLSNSGYTVGKDGILRPQNAIEKGITNFKESASSLGNSLKSTPTVVKNVASKAGPGLKSLVNPNNISTTSLAAGEAILGLGTNALDNSKDLGINSDRAAEQFRKANTSEEYQSDLTELQGNPKDWQEMGYDEDKLDNYDDEYDNTIEDEVEDSNESSYDDSYDDSSYYQSSSSSYSSSSDGSENQFKKNNESSEESTKEENKDESKTGEETKQEETKVEFEDETTKTDNMKKSPGETELPVSKVEIENESAEAETQATQEDNTSSYDDSYNDYSESETTTEASTTTENTTATTPETEIESTNPENNIDDNNEYEKTDSDGSIINEPVGDDTNITKLPKTETSKKSSGSAAGVIIPTLAGVSAAAAAGIGAKTYLDRKKNNNNDDDNEFEESEYETEEYSDANDYSTEYKADYNDGIEQQEYLDTEDENDEYSNTDEIDFNERYDARTNDELADME